MIRILNKYLFNLKNSFILTKNQFVKKRLFLILLFFIIISFNCDIVSKSPLCHKNMSNVHHMQSSLFLILTQSNKSQTIHKLLTS